MVKALTRVRAPWFLAVGVLAALVPLVVRNEFYLHLLVISGIWAIAVMGLDLLGGYGGYVSFGHAAYFGIGAYTSAILVMKAGLPFWMALPLATLVAGLVGLVVGIPTLRLTGTYFAIGTLAFGEVAYIAFISWKSVTGGVFGLTGIPAPEPIPLGALGTLDFERTTVYFYLVYALLVAVVWALVRLVNSRFGRSLVAIRENDKLAQSIGINVTWHKLAAFSISCLLAGLSGSLFAHKMGFASPVSFDVRRSLEFVIILMLGGAGTLVGPGIGAYFLSFLSQYLEMFKEFRLMAYGLILILVVMFVPGGVVGGLRWIVSALRAPGGARKQKRGAASDVA